MSLLITKTTCDFKTDPVGIALENPVFAFIIESDKANTYVEQYQLQVSKEDKGFKDLVWDTGAIACEDSINILYQGEPLQKCTRYFWRVKAWDNHGQESPYSKIAFFETALEKSSDWKAEYIGDSKEKETSACPFFRKEFKTGKKVERARAYASALGLYEFYINGSRVGDEYLTPGWTSYKNRIQYQTYDITELLLQGENAVGACIGPGWYAGNIGWEKAKNFYGDKYAFILQIHINYDDGSEDIIKTDSSWKWADGPVLMSEIYHGETYDARYESEGWNKAGFNDKSWEKAEVIKKTKSTLVPQINVPVRKTAEISPKEAFITPKGECVFDFGQNMVGWVKFSLKSEKGKKITIRHAEVLDREGNFYTENLRSAKATVSYTFKGDGKEVFEPHFTFMGFRYIEISDYNDKVELDDLKGVVICSDMEMTGSFSCSNPLVNKLWENIVWGMKGNFVDVPTDCPQRDERLGWTGDAQVFSATASIIAKTVPFFKKWLGDVKCDQFDDGAVPYVVPNVLDQKSHSACGWGDAAVIIPWTTYLAFGDKRILEDQYDSMKGYVEYIKKQGDNKYLWNTGFHYGDWLALDAKENSYFGSTSVDFLATAYYAYSCSILSKTAKIIGKEKNAQNYANLYEKIKKEFQKEFVTPNGRLVSNTQTAHVIALWFGLIEDADRERNIKNLKKLIEDDKGLTTGFLGASYLPFALSSTGNEDIAYKLLLKEDYPSWLYPVTKGATTIWEHWDGIKPDGTFWPKDMNSFNHYAYGAIGEWMVKSAAGINLVEDSPAYKKTCFMPLISEELDFVKAELVSQYGLISSSWKKEEGKIHYNFIIPANTGAEIRLRCKRTADVTLNGKRLSVNSEIYEYTDEKDMIIIKTGSGKINVVI